MHIFHSYNISNNIYVLVAFCDTPADIEVSFWTDRRKDREGQRKAEGQTDMEAEILILIVCKQKLMTVRTVVRNTTNQRTIACTISKALFYFSVGNAPVV